MIYRTLGRSGLRVSILSYGTGGARRLGQDAGMGISDQKRLIRRCLDLGVNLFDTAKGYGESESILGECLVGVPRESYHVITKWSAEESSEGDRRDDLARSVERSLRRLRTDYVDVFMMHGLTDARYDETVERYYPVLDAFRGAGKIRSIGFSTLYVQDAAQVGALTAISGNPELWDVAMIKYGILNQYAARDILPLAQDNDVGVVNMAAARARLPDPALLEQTVHEWKRAGYLLPDSLPANDPLGWLVHDDVASVVAAGYKFAADHPSVATVLTGTSSIAHLEENARALERPTLDETDKRRLMDVFQNVVEYA